MKRADIWLHIGDSGASISAMALASTLYKLDALEMHLSYAEDVAALPPPEGCHLLGHLPNKMAEMKRMSRGTQASLGIWAGGKLDSALLRHWQSKRLPFWFIELDVQSLTPPALPRFGLTLRYLIKQAERAYPKDQAAFGRLQKLGFKDNRLQPEGQLPLAPPLQKLEQDELDKAGKIIGARPVWCAVEPTYEETPWLVATHQRLRQINHRALLIVLTSQPEAFSEPGHVECLTGDKIPDTLSEQINTLLIQDKQQFSLWIRQSHVIFGGGSLSSGLSCNPLQLSMLGGALILGPDSGIYHPATEQLALKGAACFIEHQAELLPLLSHLMEPASTAQQAVKSWEALTKGAEYLDQMRSDILEFLELS